MKTNSNYITLCEMFYKTCEKFPGRPAQMFNEDLYPGEDQGQFTYSEMKARVEKIAGGLVSLGFEKQERAAIMSYNSPYWAQADYGIINTGGVTVTIFHTVSVNEITYIVNDSQSRYLFVGNQDILERALEALDSMPSLNKIIMMDLEYQSNHEKVINLSHLMKLGEEYLQHHRQEHEQRWQEITQDDWATIIYTSGTTGRGKGAILTHWTMSSRLYHSLEQFSKWGIFITEEDVNLSFLPLAHVFDRGVSQFLAVNVGACIAYADSPSTIVEDLQKYNPTWFNCVPRLYERIYKTLMEQMEQNPRKAKLFNKALEIGQEVLKYRTDQNGRINLGFDYDVRKELPWGLRIKFAFADKIFKKVRALFGNRYKLSFSAAAALSPELARFFYVMGVRVLEGYGLTETATACAFNPPSAIKPGTVGPPANGSTGRIADDGELIIGEAGLFVGYLNMPEETQEVFTPEGEFKTGDLAVKDEDGYVKIVDRKKNIICLNTGKNVAPTKIENLFSTSQVVEQLYVEGNDRKYITALLVPNFAYFISLFDREGISYNRDKLVYRQIGGAPVCVEVGEDFINQPLLQEKIAEEVETINGELEDFERVKNYAILCRRFTEERGEITPTLKTKKRAILQNYGDLIEQLYS